MLRRIWILMRLQLSDRFKFKKVDNVKKLLGKIGLITLGLVLVTAVMSLLFFLVKDIMMISTPKVITFALVLLQVLSIIACSIGLLKTLYTSKDNPILLSYPAKHFEVFISKLLVYYVYEFIKSVFTLFPMLLGYGIIHGRLDLVYIISVILMTVILPLLPVLIGSLVTIPILYIKKFIDRFAIAKTILIIGALIGLFAVFFALMNAIPRPLGVIEMYYTFVFWITDIINSVDYYSLFYQFMGNILMGQDVLLNYLYFLLTIIGLLLLVTFISMPLYFKLASSSGEMSTEKVRKKGNKAEKNTFLTFVKKEWLLTIRNFGEFLSNYIFLFAMPYVLFLMMCIFNAISLNSLGIYMTVVFSGFVALLMCSASNTASATAITKEGSEFVLLKTVPSDASKMVWAKIFFNLIYSSIMIIISYVIVIVFCPMFDTTLNGKPWPWLLDNTWLWMTMICVLFVNAGLVFWSLQIDIMNPKLREYASSGDTSGMNNASKSILVGVLMSVLFAVLALLTLLDTDNMVLNWSIIIGLSVAFMTARFILFTKYLKYIFPKIEY